MHREPVAIVTGGSSRSGRDTARGLADWRWGIVIVYLEDQRTVDAAVVEILAGGGTILAVRADLRDAIDVQRLLEESSAAYGGVDVVAHTTAQSGSLLYAQAARHVRSGGVMVSVSTADRVDPAIARELHERGITLGRAPADGLLAFLDRWRRRV